MPRFREACRKSNARPISAAPVQAASLYSSATLSRRMRFFELGAEMRRLLGDHVLAARPGGITVREVARPHELVRIELLGELEGRPVVLEGERDVLAEILRRQALQLLALHPVAVAFVGMVHAVHEVRRPAGIGLDADHACSFGMALEHAAE